MNSHGFRDKEHTYEKKKGTFRILVLGDSFTEGLEVPVEQTFPSISEERLNSESAKRFEVIKLGVSGFGTAQEYLTLIHYGLKYQPDFVILAFTIVNDIVDNSITLHPPATMPFFVLNNGKLEEIPFKIKVGADPSKNEEQTKRDIAGQFQILEDLLTKYFPNIYYSLSDMTKEAPFQILRGFFVELFPDTYHSLSNRIHKTPWLANFLWKIGVLRSKPDLLDKYKNEIPDYLQVYAQEYPPEWQDAWDVTKSLILKLAKELEMDKIGFLVVIIPNWFESQPDIRDKILDNPQLRALIDLKKPERILSKFLVANNIDYLLLRPEFEKYTKETGKRLHFPYKYEHHWDADGHALAAELIFRKLKAGKLGTNSKERISSEDN